MPLNWSELVKLVSDLADDAGLKVTVTESLKAGVLTGLATTIGGIVGGPIGLAAGGAIGAGFSAWYANGKFLPASQVIAKMDEEQQRKLCDRITVILRSIHYEDILQLQALLATPSNEQLRQELISNIVDHLRTDLHLQITYPE